MLVEVLFKASRRAGLDLREEQKEVCLEYMKGNDVIFVAPTGFGKSVVFQLAPMLLSPTSDTLPSARVIIVMPTIALIKDSMRKLHSRFMEVS